MNIINRINAVTLTSALSSSGSSETPGRGPASHPSHMETAARWEDPSREDDQGCTEETEKERRTLKRKITLIRHMSTNH